MPKRAETYRPHEGKVHQEKSKARKIRGTYRWTKISRYLRSKYPMCQFPDECNRAAESVHHIIPINRNNALAFTLTNLVPLCDHHHAHLDELERQGTECILMFQDWQEKVQEDAKGYFDDGEEEN